MQDQQFKILHGNIETASIICKISRTFIISYKILFYKLVYSTNNSFILQISFPKLNSSA